MKRNRTRILAFCLIAFTALAYFFIPFYKLTGKITGHSPLRLIFLNNRFKTTEGKVNILLLGKGDAVHDGPNLTDSMLVASYDVNNKKIFLISIPRDIWSSTLEEKINAAYAFGEAKQKGGGMILAKAEIGAVVDLPIHYAVVIDFDKFSETIDLLGGLDINVQHDFVDDKYPIKGKENDECNGDEAFKCRYETIRFEKGQQHMDGQTALKYARSRNAKGDQGSDFARGQRQQLIIGALASKILGVVKSGNAKKLEALYIELDSAIERDIENEEGAFLAKKYVLSPNTQLINIPLTEDLFEIPPVDEYFGKYVLVPKDHDFPALHKYIRCKMDESGC